MLLPEATYKSILAEATRGGQRSSDHLVPVKAAQLKFSCEPASRRALCRWMEDEPQSPPSLPLLEGYDTTVEEVNASSDKDSIVPTPMRKKKTPKKPLKQTQRQLLPRYSGRDNIWCPGSRAE